MTEKVLTIQNKLGLHARPAALFVQTAEKFKARIRVYKDDQEVNGKSVMGLMMLAAEHGSRLKIVAEGSDEKEALQALEEIFRKKFDEE